MYISALPSRYRPYPIQRLWRSDTAQIAGFVAGLDAPGLWARFGRAMDPATVRAHYAAVDWSSTIVLSWQSHGRLCALSEAYLFDTGAGAEAEIGLCVAHEWRGRGIGHRLVSAVTCQAAWHGARRSLFLLAAGDCAQAAIIRRLGGAVDPHAAIGVMAH